MGASFGVLVLVMAFGADWPRRWAFWLDLPSFDAGRLETRLGTPMLCSCQIWSLLDFCLSRKLPVGSATAITLIGSKRSLGHSGERRRGETISMTNVGKERGRVHDLSRPTKRLKSVRNHRRTADWAG